MIYDMIRFDSILLISNEFKFVEYVLIDIVLIISVI